jgi:phage terminase Nu1 subunit (DNA packaging protein)
MALKNHRSQDNKQLCRSELARHYNVSPKAVDGWVSRGCPKDPKTKAFDLAAVESWLKQRAEDNKSKPSGLREQKLQAEIDRIRRDIKRRDLEIAKEEGKLHSRDDCAASLTELRARESRILHTLPDRLAARFPELGAKLKVAAAEEIDEILGRLTDGSS